MNAAARESATPLRSVGLVGRGVLLETVRRRELYVILVFAALFLAGVLVARAVGIPNPETGTFVLNLGLTLALGAAHVLAILTAARQIPAELENRTIHPVLAKPLSRAEYLLGKWWACTATGASTFFVLAAIAWIAVPKLEDYSPPMLVQTFLAGVLSLALVAALSLLGSILIPHAMNVVLVALVVWFGHTFGGFVVARAAGGVFAGFARWLMAYVPNFNKLNLVARYTDGIGPLPPGEFLVMTLYVTICLAACFAASAFAFDRRRL